MANEEGIERVKTQVTSCPRSNHRTITGHHKKFFSPGANLTMCFLECLAKLECFSPIVDKKLLPVVVHNVTYTCATTACSVQRIHVLCALLLLYCAHKPWLPPGLFLPCHHKIRQRKGKWRPLGQPRLPHYRYEVATVNQDHQHTT